MTIIMPFRICYMYIVVFYIIDSILSSIISMRKIC
uniref:Uncharacterized protein n=1 Tax=Podoviridae sp. ct8Lf7 TaxID=2827723 RepID=A0A8S5S1L0_9CAUD|nr:MAG TPA: hypothetical protein [Podoviridae sp. ct8Lf7]